MAWTERYVRADAAGGGDGTTDTNSGANGAWTLAEAITNYAAGQRLNVRAGTYANTTTTRTFATAGTATAMIWWRGFNTTPGDIDSDNTLTKPAITFTTGQFFISADKQKFSNLDIVSASTTTGGTVRLTGQTELTRCRVENTATNANSAAVGATTAGAALSIFRDCWFKATSSAPVVSQSSVAMFYQGCYFKGGSNGISATAAATVVGCIFDSQGSHAISTSNQLVASGCTFYGAGAASVDAIRVSAATVVVLVRNCIFSEYGGYAINQSSGANGALVYAHSNAYYSCTSGQLNGVTESYQTNAASLVADPFNNKAAGDFTLPAGNAVRNAATPFTFESVTSNINYFVVGALQINAAGGGRAAFIG